MTYKTVTVDVTADVDVDLNEWDDEELAEELRDRGWFVSKADVGAEKFEREDFDLLMGLVDTSDNPLYTKNTLREKLLGARHGG